jgi:pyridoxamine 5'-phosphate oxidase
MADLQNIRKEFSAYQLDIDNLDENPIVQFRYWLNEAIKSEVAEPTAMALSTVSEGSQPSSRIVLLKSLDVDGFTFFTNYESRKGRQIELNPAGSLLFFWPQLERQVRIEGKIYKTLRHESDEYFRTRPKEAG